MKTLPLSALAVTLLVTSTASAQTVVNYWDFSSMDDAVGGVIGTAVGTPDISIHPTYGEAYPGSGPSINTISQALATGVGGGCISADVFNGTPTSMDFGANSYSFSYWIYDDFSDGDARGPRPFDNLLSTSTGIQVTGDTAGSMIFRQDDDAGVPDILVAPGGWPMPDQWIHIAITVDRPNSLVEFYANGVSLGTLASSVTGNIFPTQDMTIGLGNFGISAGEAQLQGLDDLAFYDGVLSASDVAGLASGALTPLNFGPGVGTPYCFGDGSGTACPCGNLGSASSGCANSTSSGAILGASGSVSVVADDLVLNGTQLPPGVPSLFFQGSIQVNGGTGGVFGDGLLCAGGAIQRMQIAIVDGSGNASTSVAIASGFGAVVGNSNTMQLWYRDPSGPCNGLFNTTNGLSVTWQ